MKYWYKRERLDFMWSWTTLESEMMPAPEKGNVVDQFLANPGSKAAMEHLVAAVSLEEDFDDE